MIATKSLNNESEEFVINRLEKSLGSDFTAVRHSLLQRGLIRTLADEDLLEGHVQNLGYLHGDRLANARARFTLAVIQLSELLDDMGIEYPQDVELLLVEDDPNDEAATCRAIGRMEINPDIKIARDGSEALACLQGSDSFPTMVLLDLKLPKVGGVELLSALRADPVLRNLIVVVFSSSDLDEDRTRCRSLGVQGFIRKPLAPAEYAEAVQTAIQIGIGSYRELGNLRRPAPMYA